MKRTIIVTSKLSIKTASGWQDHSVRMSQGDTLTVTDPDGEKIKLSVEQIEVKDEGSTIADRFDECPYCGDHMPAYADTYEFNRHYADCPSCGRLALSGYTDGKFVWKKPTEKEREEDRRNKIEGKVNHHLIKCKAGDHRHCPEFMELTGLCPYCGAKHKKEDCISSPTRLKRKVVG